MASIRVRRETKTSLDRLRSKGETYDDVVRTLIEQLATKKPDTRWNRILWNRILSEERFVPLEVL